MITVSLKDPFLFININSNEEYKLLFLLFLLRTVSFKSYLVLVFYLYLQLQVCLGNEIVISIGEYGLNMFIIAKGMVEICTEDMLTVTHLR